MTYLGGVEESVSPKIGAVKIYFLRDLGLYPSGEDGDFELRDNPHQIQDMPRGTMLNPTTVKMILMDVEEILNEQEEPVPYIHRTRYAGPSAIASVSASERASRLFPGLGGLTDVEPGHLEFAEARKF